MNEDRRSFFFFRMPCCVGMKAWTVRKLAAFTVGKRPRGFTPFSTSMRRGGGFGGLRGIDRVVSHPFRRRCGGGGGEGGI
jgi:hypothetical protein